MARQLFHPKRFQNRSWIQSISTDGLWMMMLFLAALLLYSINLGGVPLRDWDEGIVAQVAREILQGESNWLYPTLHGDPYLNKPPLVHGLVAITYQLGGVNEWMARLPSALLTAISVPWLYSLGRELSPQRTPALFSALVYLTLLPVVRQGRLAMLEGTVLFLLIAMLWCVMRSRRNLRYALGSGLAFGLLCLTKGILLGILLGAITALFLLWDTPRLLRSPYLWIGLLLGSLPVVGWYIAQGLERPEFFGANLFDQSLKRVWDSVESNGGGPWYYLVELLKYSWPWLIFWPQALQFTWNHRNFSWSRLILVWTGVYLGAISLMGTKLPWYVLPLYPAMALCIGFYLAEIWREGDPETGRWLQEKSDQTEASLESLCPQPQQLWPIFIVIAAAGLVACLYYGHLLPRIHPTMVETDLQLAMGACGITMAFTALLLFQRERQFLVILIWGSYLSLLMFFHSSHWVWELAEDYPVKPVAAMIQTSAPQAAKIYTSHPYSRPSLNFYGDRKIRSRSSRELKEIWQTSDQPYLLLNQEALSDLRLPDAEKIDSVGGWSLVTRRLSSP
ncbi:MAG: ArnT family glycosyltransferase [Microcoleaceae cyanobacterium]